jgi:DNA-binding LacI/PurR family transcriptional regulator
MGELGANLLMDIIEGKADPEVDNRFVLEPTLVVRESSDGRLG